MKKALEEAAERRKFREEIKEATHIQLTQSIHDLEEYGKGEYNQIGPKLVIQSQQMAYESNELAQQSLNFFHQLTNWCRQSKDMQQKMKELEQISEWAKTTEEDMHAVASGLEYITHQIRQIKEKENS